MLSENRNRKVHVLTGEDSITFQAMEQADLAASRRADAEALAKGGIAAATFYETEQEKAALSKFVDMDTRIRKEFGYSASPIYMVAPANQATMTPRTQQPFKGGLDSYHQYSQKPTGAPTHMELAELFIQRVGWRIRRVGQRVFFFNGKYHELLEPDRLRTMILDELREELRISGQARQIDNVVNLLMAESRIEANFSEADSTRLCLENGILDLRTFELIPHNVNYFFTWKLTAEWRGPVACPVCDEYFQFAAGNDPILVQRFWEALGYIISPDNNAKAFFLLQGPGNTGKSLYGTLISLFFEQKDIGSIPIYDFKEADTAAFLDKKRVNVSMELSNSGLSNEAIGKIKEFTGGDYSKARELYHNPYTTKIKTKLVFGTNHLLRTDSVDPAFLERVKLLPFEHTVPPEKQRKDMEQRLRAELSGILYKALISYRGLVQKNYYFSGDDRYSMAHMYQGNVSTLDQIELIKRFASQHCIADPTGFVPTDILFAHYQAFCQNLNVEPIRNKTVFSGQFKSTVSELIPIEQNKRRVDGVPLNGYKGISIKV